MKIEGQGPINPLERILRKEKDYSKKQVKGESQAADKIEISDEAFKMQQLAFIKEIIKEISDVRLDKVQQVKEQLARGNYKVDSKEVAKKILDFYS